MTDHTTDYALVIPGEECGEVFYGWSDPEWISHMDFSVPRQCNLPVDHRGDHDWYRVLPAGFYPLPENRTQRRQRLLQERRRMRRAAIAQEIGERKA